MCTLCMNMDMDTNTGARSHSLNMECLYTWSTFSNSLHSDNGWDRSRKGNSQEMVNGDRRNLLKWTTEENRKKKQWEAARSLRKLTTSKQNIQGMETITNSTMMGDIFWGCSTHQTQWLPNWEQEPCGKEIHIEEFHAATAFATTSDKTYTNNNTLRTEENSED